MNQHQGRLRGISRIYEDIAKVSLEPMWCQWSFGENLAHLGIAGQDAKIVMRALSGAGVQWIIVHTSETFLLVWSAWLRLFGARCSQVYHAPRSILLSLWLCSWNQYHQSRSSGVEETDWSEATSYSEQDEEMSNADRVSVSLCTLLPLILNFISRNCNSSLLVGELESRTEVRYVIDVLL